MKKIGKKLSYITKVLLVLGLIISNLSSLTVVFADVGDEETLPNSEILTLEDEGETSLESEDETALEDEQPSEVLPEGSGETVPEKVATGLEASISEDNKITVKYGTEVNDTDELQIRITESYDYNNCVDTDSITCKNAINNSYAVANADRELLLGEGMVISYEPSLLESAKFDGTYKLTLTLVNVTNDNEVLDEKVIDEVNNTFDSGILFKVYDSADALVSETDGKYVFGTSNETIKVVGKMQAGGISPNDVFSYTNRKDETTEFTALEILDFEFEYPINLGGYLYADFKLPISVVYTKNGEETEYIKQLNISHGTYEDNTKKLNALVDQNKLLFEGTTKEGKLYVYLSEEAITIDDIDKLLYDTYYDSDNVWYRLSNEELDAETLITLEDGITTMTYQVVVVGDINGDGVLDQEDVIALANQLVGNEELDLDKANIDDSDKEANVRDILKLTQIVKTGAWKIETVEKEIQLDPQLQLQDSEQEITSGDEFEVNYVLVNPEDDVNGFAGLVNYDKSKLELVSMTVVNNFVGSNKDGKFVYVQMNETSKGTTSEGEDEIVKLLTLKFKALTSGDSQIKIDNPEYFDEDTYYKVVEIDEETGESKPSTKVISLDVTTSQSSDNSLSSLKIGDNEIQLKDGVYDYELTVPNNVTKLDVSALTSNLAASITSIVSPEELVEGENTITVTVVSESGEESTYTVVVTREKVPEETTNNDNQTNYQDYTPNNNNNNHNVKPADDHKNDDKKDVEPVEPVKEKGNLSKIIIIVLILLVIAGLIYLIFKDDDDEGKKANKDINKFKKEDFDSPSEKTVNNSNKKNQNKNNKKGR